jgi:hypothetical protein
MTPGVHTVPPPLPPPVPEPPLPVVGLGGSEQSPVAWSQHVPFLQTKPVAHCPASHAHPCVPTRQKPPPDPPLPPLPDVLVAKPPPLPAPVDELCVVVVPPDPPEPVGPVEFPEPPQPMIAHETRTNPAAFEDVTICEPF